MHSIAEIEKAVGSLSAAEREIFESRLLAQRFGLAALEGAERAELLASLEEADRQIDAGEGQSGAELREAMRSWLGK